jgi:hypothetical protein
MEGYLGVLALESLLVVRQHSVVGDLFECNLEFLSLAILEVLVLAVFEVLCEGCLAHAWESDGDEE